MVAAVGLLIFPTSAFATVNVTVVNQSDYPWLVKGTYADYFGGQQDYVLPNGTLTISGLTSVSFGFSSSSGNTTLDWVMLNRTGDSAWIQISYHASGCDSSEEQYNDYYKNNFTHPLQCVKVDFNTSLTLEVNLPTREAFVDSQPVGILNLWAPPLIDNQPAYVGTAFVGGVRHDLMANASAPSTTGSHAFLSGWNGKPLTINESDTAYGGPFTYYTLSQTTFGTGPTSTYGWIKSVNENLNTNATFIPKVDPSGIYNYYNGLALQFSQPDYPISQTVCEVDKGQPINCAYTAYGTALGTYFRGAQSVLFLTATNIPLEPSQSPTGQSPSRIPLMEWVAVAIASAAVVLSGVAVVYWMRKHQHESNPQG